MMREIVRMLAYGVVVAGASFPAGAVPLTVGQNVSTDGVTFTLSQCNNNAGGGGCGVGTFLVLAGPVAGIVIGGPASGGPLQSTNLGGYVDTFLQFKVSGPIASVASLGVLVSGCGGNTSAAGCSTAPNATTHADESGTTVYTSTDIAHNNQLATSSIDFWNVASNVNQIAVSQTFAPQTTVYLNIDLSSHSWGGGYASFDSIVVTVSEPASSAVLAFGVAGLAALRRRRVATQRDSTPAP